MDVEWQQVPFPRTLLPRLYSPHSNAKNTETFLSPKRLFPPRQPVQTATFLSPLYVADVKVVNIEVPVVPPGKDGADGGAPAESAPTNWDTRWEPVVQFWSAVGELSRGAASTSSSEDKGDEMRADQELAEQTLVRGEKSKFVTRDEFLELKFWKAGERPGSPAPAYLTALSLKYAARAMKQAKGRKVRLLLTLLDAENHSYIAANDLFDFAIRHGHSLHESRGARVEIEIRLEVFSKATLDVNVDNTETGILGDALQKPTILGVPSLFQDFNPRDEGAPAGFGSQSSPVAPVSGSAGGGPGEGGDSPLAAPRGPKLSLSQTVQVGGMDENTVYTQRCFLRKRCTPQYFLHFFSGGFLAVN